MFRLVLPAAILALSPAAATAQLPFYFSQPPGNPAFGYQPFNMNPLTPPTIVYQPLTGPGVGPFFAPTVFNGFSSPVSAYPDGFPMFTAGRFPTFGTFGYVPQLPLTVVVEQPILVPGMSVPTGNAAVSIPLTPTAPAATPALAESRVPATLTLRFPAAAKVWLDGAEVKGPAAVERVLTSPPLRPGEKYTFKVRAEWTANGKTETFARDTVVWAGDQARSIVLGGNTAGGQ
jgi:uncharacterized protein (TIGR03000 family)